MPPDRSVHARRKIGRTLVLLVCCALLVVAGLSLWFATRPSGRRAAGSLPATARREHHPAPGSPRGATTTTNPPSSTTAPPTTARGGSPPGGGSGARGPSLEGLAVSYQQLALVDHSRPVESGGQVLAPARSLPTDVWLPQAAGRFPLVVFASGYDVGPMTYQRFCSTLAASGYVVAAPSFPLEDPSSGFPLDEADLPNEAGDVSFVISSMLGGPLSSRIDTSEVAVVGHSDGADVALMAGYQQGRIDPRVRAVVADAPDPMTGTIVGSNTPLLLMQGDADPVVPYTSSQEVFTQVQAPRYYLTLLGADHLSPIVGDSPWTPALDAAVHDFLDATVADRGPGAGALSSELSSSSLVRLETAP